MPPISQRQHPDRLAAIVARQEQAASRAQLSSCGYESDAIRRRVMRGRWQAVGRAVVLHNGPPSRRTLMWAAVLSVHGPAAIGARTAAAGYRLRGFESDQVEVVVSMHEKVPQIDGVRWHHSRRFTTADISPGPRPAAVRPARAVIDAATWTDQPRIACALVVAAVQQRVSSAADLREALNAAGQVRHRAHLNAVLADIEGGADSLSEVDFSRLVRRAGLPPPVRQSVRLDAWGRRRYLDADFETFVAEIDGAIHLQPLNHWDDARRQNDLVLGGDRILRFPSIALRLEPEVVIAQLRRAREVFGPPTSRPRTPPGGRRVP